jgi:hypothetical protein
MRVALAMAILDGKEYLLENFESFAFFELALTA